MYRFYFMMIPLPFLERVETTLPFRGISRAGGQAISADLGAAASSRWTIHCHRAPAKSDSTVFPSLSSHLL